MKTLFTSCLLLACSFALQAQKTFDPACDTIATTNARGIWKIVVPDQVLIASAQQVAPNLSAVHDVRVQDIHGKPYIFLRGRHREHPEFGYTMMVQLSESAEGIWKTGNIYQACWGAACTECGFDEYWGCSCERYDGPPDETTASYCNHMIALGMGLMKVEISD